VLNLNKGSGWRLGWNPQAGQFPGLLGADDWAIELTLEELADFCRLSQQLADTLGEMSAHLMAEERICCEVESDRLWLEVEGFPQSYELRVMLLLGRRGEGAWPATAVPGLMQAVYTLAPQLS
jgi:hypothetical protein